MDRSDPSIIFIDEVNSKKSEGIPCLGDSDTVQANGDHLKGDVISSCNGDEMNEDVPDFDDLEVLDCWEEVEESNEETEQIEPSKEQVDEPVSNSSSTKVKTKGSEINPTNSKQTEELTRTSQTNKIATEKNLTTLDKPKTTSNNNLKPKKADLERTADQKVKDSSNNASVKCIGETSMKKKGEEKVENVKNDQKESKKNSSLSHLANAHRNNAAEPEKSSRRSNESSKDKELSYKKCNEKDSCRSGLNLPKDPTESKVDRFLKEMARQNPHIISLNETPHDEKSLEPISSDSSKHSSIVSPPGLDPSDLPPGVDMDQVAQDTGTSLLLNTIRQSQTQPSWGNQELSQQLPRDGADTSNREKLGRRRSPYSKNQDKSQTMRNSGSPVSSHESFSLSPSPTPRSRRLSPSSLQSPRVPQTYNYTVSNMSSGYSKRPYLLPTPLLERNRYHRSPVREQSRSLSRERLRHRSRSRSWSRGRSYARHRSRSRHRYSSKEERFRGYHRSSSHNRSPNRRIRSRSRSQSRHQYSNKRSPLWDDEQRSKRPRLSRSISRSRSPWQSHAETPSNEWHTNYSNSNRNPLLDEEVKLEHDMARFIATNIAATGLRPPGWFEAGVKPHDVMPSSSQAISEPPPDIVDHGMPLPPPPPDISELMTPEEIKETKNQREMSPVPTVSLSSLLESAVTGFPEKVILDRCQDAIMKLHDVSIKPGRFAVISTIKVPQSEPSSTFQPWQSVLNRSLASKIHFTFSRLSEQPIYWKPKPIPIRAASSSGKDALPGSSSHSLLIPVSSTVDMDRSALLEKIFLLTRELQEVRRLLDSRTTPKRNIAVQVSCSNYCDSCGIEMDSMLPVERQTHKEGSFLATSSFQSNSSLVLEPTRQPIMDYGPSWQPVPQPVPAPQSVRQPQPVPAPQSLKPPVPPPQSARHPQSVPPPQSARLPQPVPAPLQVPAPKTTPQASGSLISLNPSGSSLLGPPPTAGPSETINWCVTEQPGPSSGLGGASSSQSHVAFSLTGQQSGTNQSVNQIASIPTLMSAVSKTGVTKKTAKNKTVPAQKAAPLQLTAKQGIAKMSPADYDITKYQMVGDEHMIDLISYLCSIGKQINYNPKLVSFGLNIDNLLKNVIGAGNAIHRQIPVILFFGMYDANYGAKTLCKFKQLVGYLKNRCGHLVLIEPPPLPKHTSTCKDAWNLFNTLKQSFSPFQSENVSVVKVMSFLLSNPGTPNRALFADSQRLGSDGLKLIAEELEKEILAAKMQKFRSS